MAAPPAAHNNTADNFHQQASLSGKCPLPTPNAPPSYWLDTSTAPSEQDGVVDGRTHPLPQHADLVIIGSGMTGVSAAYHAACKWSSSSAAPPRILLLEARDFCSGATGRNGGHLTPISPLLYRELSHDPAYLTRFLPGGATSPREEVFGRDVGVRTDDVVRRILMLEARTHAELLMLVRVAARSTEPGDDPHLVNAQNWVLCQSADEESEMQASLEHARRAGLSDLTRAVRRVHKHELDAALGGGGDGSDGGAHGVLSAYEISGATVHPRRLVGVLWRAARSRAAKRGIDLTALTQTPVHAVQSLPSGTARHRLRLETAHGTIDARYVLHATNGYVSHLCPQLGGASGVLPTRGQVIAAKARADAPPASWEMGISANGGYEYLSRRPAGEDRGGGAGAGAPTATFVLGGGRQGAKPGHEWGVADDAALNPAVSKILRGYLGHHLPATFDADARCTHEWSGIMGFTRTWHPFVGPLLRGAASAADDADCPHPASVEPGQFVSVGYSGHGMPRAFSCAEVTVDMMVAEEAGTQWVAPSWFPMCFLTGIPGASSG